MPSERLTPEELLGSIDKALADVMKRRAEIQEEWTRAWVAETGTKPSECELVEERPDGRLLAYRWYFRPRMLDNVTQREAALARSERDEARAESAALRERLKLAEAVCEAGDDLVSNGISGPSRPTTKERERHFFDALAAWRSARDTAAGSKEAKADAGGADEESGG